jgi:hypothetical protein
VLAVLNTSYHRNLGMGRSPYSVLTGKEPDKELSAKLKKEAESRRNYKLYIKGAIPEGAPVKVSMRVDGPSSVKDAIKGGQRKGYLPSFGDKVWRVRLRRGNLYWLVDKEGKPREGAVDRADLLALPSDSPKDSWRKPEVITVRDEPTPKETVRVRIKPPKPVKEYTGPHKELIGKTFKVVGIGQEEDGDGKKVDVGYYKRMRFYETVNELKSYTSLF